MAQQAKGRHRLPRHYYPNISDQPRCSPPPWRPLPRSGGRPRLPAPAPPPPPRPCACPAPARCAGVGASSRSHPRGCWRSAGGAAAAAAAWRRFAAPPWPDSSASRPAALPAALCSRCGQGLGPQSARLQGLRARRSSRPPASAPEVGFAPLSTPCSTHPCPPPPKLSGTRRHTDLTAQPPPGGPQPAAAQGWPLAAASLAAPRFPRDRAAIGYPAFACGQACNL